MSQAEQQISWLESSLGRAVGDAFAAALSVPEPAGSSPPWSELLRVWGVDPIGDDERVRVRAATHMTHGAPADEVYAVLTRIGEWAKTKLPDTFDLEGTLEKRCEKLGRAIDELRSEWLSRYKQQVMPAPSGGMFAHAMAAAQTQRPEVEVSKRTIILRCQNCGGPRLTEGEFECEFCGHHLGEKGPRRQW